MRIAEFFQDDEKVLSIGRACLATGLVLSTILGVAFFYYFRTSETPTVMWDWAIVATPGVIGLFSYIFSKLYDVKEEIAAFVSKNKSLFESKK